VGDEITNGLSKNKALLHIPAPNQMMNDVEQLKKLIVSGKLMSRRNILPKTSGIQEYTPETADLQFPMVSVVVSARTDCQHYRSLSAIGHRNYGRLDSKASSPSTSLSASCQPTIL
jgi:hypothetical protein